MDGLGTVAMEFVPWARALYRLHHADLGHAFGIAAGRHPANADRCVALILGIGGIAVLLDSIGFARDGGEIIGIALLFAAAILFAIGNILDRTPLPMPPLVVVAW